MYLGVAPDQNFTYIVAIQPRIAFIVDIRRGNLLQHLMYKAIIELSARSRGVPVAAVLEDASGRRWAKATVVEMFTAFVDWTCPSTVRGPLPPEPAAIRDHLLKTHGFPLSKEDLEQLESIYFAFFWDGPGLRYSTSPTGLWAAASAATSRPTKS